MTTTFSDHTSMNPATTTTPLLLPSGQTATLRTLLLAVNREEVLNLLRARYGDDVASFDPVAYTVAMVKLLEKPPYSPSAIGGPFPMPILLEYCPPHTYGEAEDPWTDPECVHTCLLNLNYQPPAADLKPWGCTNGEAPPEGYYDCNAERHNEIFGMGFTPWADLIDATILLRNAPEVQRLLPTLEHVAAEVIWELTWYGLSEEQQQAKLSDLEGMIDDYRLNGGEIDLDEWVSEAGLDERGEKSEGQQPSPPAAPTT